MASFVHSVQHNGTDLKYCKQVSQTETTYLFFPATSWKCHSSKFQNCLLCLSSLRRSRDVTTNIYDFNILNSVFYLFVLFIYLSYIFILYICLFILIYLFIIFRLPPSAIAIRQPPSASAFHFLILQTPVLQSKSRLSNLWNKCVIWIKSESTCRYIKSKAMQTKKKH